MWRKATLATGSYIGLTTAANVASPLKIVWDLDETLVSSSQQKSKWREDQKNQHCRSLFISVSSYPEKR